ncbi:nucleotidyltransferase substrate binding protein [Thalassotalea eurytherma]|uniref:Nucleotidyltransferase n=1 Tax=Thalassotalea eurytherma TaxID=1144278 RepID=A0ABQ6H165_9GAMM|nr:nucleotidyltransferase substrate binding protein [Thalassotalea eurytherma]GLX81289.1 nucleotidyltransferase [Thalassotalea eurytherma]
MSNDIRWHQRLANFDLALKELADAVTITEQRQLSRLEEQGLIQAFEYNYELAWNTIKDFYQDQGELSIQGSRDAFRLAFQRGLIEDGQLWMEMIKSRVLTSHTYNKETARRVANQIICDFYPAFVLLNNVLHQKKGM